VEADRASLTAEPGEHAISVRITRGKGLTGPVRLELVLPAQLRGVLADGVSVPAGASSAVLTIRFAPGACGPCNAPVVLRATAMDHREPVTAEAKLEIRDAVQP
jgi:hypothetical protein